MMCCRPNHLRAGISIVPTMAKPLKTAPATRKDDNLLEELLGDMRVAQLDRFDRVQLAEVVRTCRRHRSLSAAGRELFAASRARRASTNDTDRLRKYLARFDLDFASVAG